MMGPVNSQKSSPEEVPSEGVRISLRFTPSARALASSSACTALVASGSESYERAVKDEESVIETDRLQ
jgi:hypothetical protein